MEHGAGIAQSVDHDGRQCGGLRHAEGRQPCWQRIVCAAARDQSSEAPFGMGSCFHRQRWIRFCSNDQQRPAVWHASVLYSRFERFCRYSGQRPRSRDHIHAADAIGHEIMRRLTPTVEVHWDYLTVGLKLGLVDLFGRHGESCAPAPMKSLAKSIQFGDSYTCTYCLQTIKWDHHRSRPTRDHFIPKSKLLKDHKTEFVLCCQWCNSRKSDKVFSSIEEARKYIASRKPPKIPSTT